MTDHKDIHHLYSPKSRRAEFAAADWRFLIRVAANLSRAVATIHAARGVIADINHSGVLVGQDARVRLIDCDSFQIVDAGKTYLCDVGVPTFTPPELQGLLFAEIVRTPNHDNFGLAVLIFLTLFMGRHPFAGRFSASAKCRSSARSARAASPTAPIARRSRWNGRRARRRSAIVSPAIAGLFERAFARESRDAGRPTAARVGGGLGSRSSTSCVNAPSVPRTGISTGCRAARGAAWKPRPASRFSRLPSRRALRRISTSMPSGAGSRHWSIPVPRRRSTAADPRRKLRPSLAALQFKQRRALHRLYALMLSAAPIPIAIFVSLPPAARLLFLAAAVGLYYVARMLVRLSNDTTGFADRARMDLEHFEKVRDEWQSTAGPGRFDAKRTELERLRVRWDESRDVPAPKAAGAARPQAGRGARARFLDGFDIEAGGVSGLSPSRVPLLESFGIETAADIVDREARWRARSSTRRCGTP